MSKIIILNNDLDLGGIQKSLIDFLRYLIAQTDYEVYLVLWQRDGALLKHIPPEVNVRMYDYPSSFKDACKTKSLKLKWKALVSYTKFNFCDKILKKPWLFFPSFRESFDIAISYSQNGYPLFYTIDKLAAKKKYLWYHHGSYEATGSVHILNKKYYPKFDKLVTVSHANKDMLNQHFAALTHKITVVPNMLNVNDILDKANETINEVIAHQNRLTFVTVSRFSKEKGIDLAIAIAYELKNQGLSFRWYFIGDGDLFYEIKQQIADKNLEKECILLGNKINPYPYMKQADIYIQPSYVESQSLTVYEALVLKKLIIASNLPALQQALKNGTLGVLCDTTVESFVKEILNLATDKGNRERIKQAVMADHVSNDFAYQELKKIV